MSEITTTAAPGRSPGRQPRRVLRSLLGLAAAACTLALALSVAPAAQAQVNPLTSRTIPWGDCPVTLGTVKWTNNWAVGGVDVQCYHRHDYVGANVSLWRLDGSSWTLVGFGAGALTYKSWVSVATRTPVCDVGWTTWDVTAQVYVTDGDRSYSQTFELGRQGFRPGSC